MTEWLRSLGVAFSTLLLVVDPFGLVPTYAALTSGRPPAEVERIARRASLVGAAVLATFTAVGRSAPRLLGVGVDAFRAAGGRSLLLR